MCGLQVLELDFFYLGVNLEYQNIPGFVCFESRLQKLDLCGVEFISFEPI